eukprot:TRINITY_DN11554_c0_g1_i1.p1 TRINITY_DN11554_c0_g1~~TRINITY_DN11554_c0_g1_i1.p1  ORF type:complete len:316 (-),score=50.54 TRINITY_DN11554_c0_g1_i1:97-1044(-)
MIRRPPRSTLSSSSAASDVYKRQLAHQVKQCSSMVIGRDDPAPGSTHLLRVQPHLFNLHLPPDTVNFAAGLVGGTVGASLMHPLDSLRVLAQSSLNKPLSARISMLRQAGLLAGIAPSVASNAATFCLLFGFQGRLEQHTAAAVGGHGLLATGLAGSLTGLLLAPLLGPLELWKCRRQSGVSMSSSVAMHRGLAATALRCGFGNAAFFVCIEAAKSTYPSEDSLHLMWRDMLVGATSGVAYWLVACPFDLIKSRQQLSKTATTMMFEANAAIQAAGSVVGLWRGLGMAVARTLPMQACVMAAYGLVQRSVEVGVT